MRTLHRYFALYLPIDKAKHNGNTSTAATRLDSHDLAASIVSTTAMSILLNAPI